MTQAIFLAVALALAAGPRGRASSRLTAAQAQFNRGDFDAALQSLRIAEGETTDDGTLAKIKLLEGQCYGAQRDLPNAEEAFAGALKHDPEARLDPAKVDPDLVSLINNLRDRLRGELIVHTDRPAKVTVEGRALPGGHGQVGLGRRTVEARSPDGRYVAREQVVIDERTPTEVNLTLSEQRGEGGEGRSGEGRNAEVAPGSSGPVLFGFGKPFAEIRLGLDPVQWNENVKIEIGAGLENTYLRLSVSARVFSYFGLVPRAAFTVPVNDQFRAYVSAELPILFPNGLAMGIGGTGGAEYLVSRWLSLFGEIGADFYFVHPAYFDDTRLTLNAGVRLRLP